MEFGHISEIRALVRNINMMALTATATVQMRKVILSSLEMENSHLVIREPNKLNIKYHVYKKSDPEIILQSIVQAVARNGISTDRCIIFCRSYLDTLTIFQSLVCTLGRRGLLYAPYQPGTEKCRYRLCEKYDGSTSSKNQSHIIDSFTKLDGVVRIVVATIAFGMGLDSPNVRKIIHWGAPDDVSMYIQELVEEVGTECHVMLCYI